MKIDDFRSGWALLSIFFLVIVFWLAWGVFAPNFAEKWFDGNPPNISGVWGDTFGALNTLFTGLAFVGALAAVMMQGETLRRQQADQHRQKFEVGLFELFRMLQMARDNFEFTAGPEHVTHSPNQAGSEVGIAAFKQASMEMTFWVRREGGPDAFSSGDLGRMYTRRVHRRRESLLGPYFRIVYTILKKIKNDEFLSEKEKEGYGNLLRTQLTSYEVSLAGYNALAPYANDFKDLIVEFRMLKYLPEGQRKRALIPHYPARVFEGREA